MSITVKEARKLKNFRKFNLIAGEWGLGNPIEKIGILDHEIVEDINGEFAQGDFVLTSFTPARDNIPLLIHSIQRLIKSNVSGLAIKNIYFKELPPLIINLANKMNFPIFIFDDKIFYEDIIAEINEEIRSKDNDALLATKIDILLKDSVSKGMIRELALELNHSFKENFLVCFCKEKKYIDDKYMTKLLNLFHFQVHKSIYHSVIKYRDGILIICTTDTQHHKHLMKELEKLLQSIGIEGDAFIRGISNMHQGLDHLSKGIHQALYAVKSAPKNTLNNIHYTDIGIHQILLPFIDNGWIREYSQRILTPLIAYDKKHHTQILKTAITYIEEDQSIKRTAEVLYQHDNTIRYRIKKIKELLDMSHLEGGFNEQLSIAVKIYLLKERRH